MTDTIKERDETAVLLRRSPPPPGGGPGPIPRGASMPSRAPRLPAWSRRIAKRKSVAGLSGAAAAHRGRASVISTKFPLRPANVRPENSLKALLRPLLP